MTPEKQTQALHDIRRSLEGRDTVEVLLIEDDPFDAEIVKERLSNYRINVTWSKTAEEALELLRQGYDFIILLDLKSNCGMTGLDFLKRLKVTGARRKIIVLTGAYIEDSEECKEALRLGALAILLKPLTREKIEMIFGRL